MWKQMTRSFEEYYNQNGVWRVYDVSAAFRESGIYKAVVQYFVLANDPETGYTGVFYNKNS